LLKKLPSLINFPQMEEEILEFWKKENIFKRSVEERKGNPRFSFYEGPPTANAVFEINVHGVVVHAK